MNSIIYILKNKSIWLVTILISVLFIIVPHMIFKQSYVLCVLVLLLELWILFRNVKGLSCLILAYGFMIPSVSADITLGASRYVPFLYVTLAIICNLLFLKRKEFYFKAANKIIGPILVLGVAFAFLNYSGTEVNLVIFFLLSTLGVVYIGFIDKISLYEFFSVLDIIFYFTIAYAFLEFFLHISPYQDIYSDMLIDLQLRAKGLCGHPIIFSSFLSFYLISLVIKYILYKEFSYFNFVLIIPFLFLSASRTGFLLIGVALLLFIILEKLYKRPVFILASALLIIFLIGSYSYISNLIGSDIVDRLFNTESQQRLSSFTVTENVFSKNIFGIGLSRDALKRELSRNMSVRNSKFDSDFLVLDNSFLTLLIAYGLFSFIFYVPYFQPLIYSFKLKRLGYPKHFHSLLLLFIIWLLQNFSFDAFYHFQINAFYFFLAVLIIKHQKITQQKDIKKNQYHELTEQMDYIIV